MPISNAKFAEKHPELEYSFFDQGIFLKANAAKNTDVAEGVCHELSRMWLFIRNFPTVLTDIPDDDWGQSKEMTFLQKHIPTLMVAQSDYQKHKGGVIAGMRRIREIFGLSEHEFLKADNQRLLKELWRKGRGTLAHVGLDVTAGGNHAIAFDTRNGFALFDPNTGVWEATGAFSQTAASKFILDYYTWQEVKTYRVCTYTKCA
jgi:hypothetical protein